jgi:hypothetical protein
MISMFIDDELDYDEKIEFVEEVHADVTVKEEILSLLKQEKKLHSNFTDRVPVIKVDIRPKLILQFWRPLAFFMSGVAAAFVIFFSTQPELKIAAVPYRFVI